MLREVGWGAFKLINSWNWMGSWGQRPGQLWVHHLKSLFSSPLVFSLSPVNQAFFI